MPPETVIDVGALRDFLGPAGPWAVEAGRRIAKRRNSIGYTVTSFAKTIGVSRTAVVEIEKGALVPRDYLKAAIAIALARDIDEIWQPPTRERIYEIAGVLP